MTEHEERLAAIEASEMSGPNKLAATCEEMLAELTVQRDRAKTRANRKPLNSRLRALRIMLRWAKSRAGYVER